MSRTVWGLIGAVALTAATAAAMAQPQADHHVHLISPAAGAAAPGLTAVTAKGLIQYLDDAGIRTATVLSVAYVYGDPNAPPVADEYMKVRAENDWVSAQLRPFEDRLRGFCAFNPLKEYAVAELERCSRDSRMRYGIKLHFGNSDVDLTNDDHVERVRAVVRAANAHAMSIVVHLRPSVSPPRAYGRDYARVFLERIVAAAPDVTVQIAHLGGAGGYDDPSIDDALSVFVNAVRKGDPRAARVYFDVAGVAGIGDWRQHGARIAERIRELGTQRIVYGSDVVVPVAEPRGAWEMFAELPLSAAERQAIAANVAPFMR